MIGQHFDNIYFYTKSIEKSRGLGYKSKNGISDKLLFQTLKSFDWDAKNLASDSKLWNYVFGKNIDGNVVNSSPFKERTNEVWRRIVNNIPYLLKHKGTRRGVYALLSCYGIPSSNLSLLEFGGPEVDNTNSKSKLVMDNFTTALSMINGSVIEFDWKNFYFFNFLKKFFPSEIRLLVAHILIQDPSFSMPVFSTNSRILDVRIRVLVDLGILFFFEKPNPMIRLLVEISDK
jgi:hypothetical protein